MKITLPVCFVFLVLLSGAAYADVRDDAFAALGKAEQYMQEMQAMNFSVARVNDTLVEAKYLFEAQELINRSGGKPDFSIVMQKVGVVEQVRKDALNTYDELVALEKHVADIKENNTLVQSYLAEARDEFANERYEQARSKIEETYKKISEQQALTTKLATALDASQRNIASFFANNWPGLTAGSAAFVVFVLFFGNRFRVYRIKRKIKYLDMEKGLIVDLIKETQSLYFDKGKIPEDTYVVRIKKFGELIRDIERQIPLLRADLESGKRMFFRLRV